MNGPDPTEFAIRILVLFLAVGIHEFSHAKFADMAGDPTPRSFGRVTLNLFKHFDPIGAVFILMSSWFGFGLGWGKPCPMDSRKMHNPRWDFFIAVLAGPLSNMAQAVVYGLTLRILAPSHPPVLLGMFLLSGLIVNLSLCFFNLIPIGPLDGHWLLGLLMPEQQRYKWFLFNRQVGMFILLLLIFLDRGLLQSILEPPVTLSARLILGGGI